MTSTHTRISSLPGTKAKIRYIWDYYKLPIIFVCIVIYIIGYILYGHFTEKNQILSAAFVNFVPGEKLSEHLEMVFLTHRKLMIPEMRFVCTKVYILQITKIILTTNTPTPPV